MKDARYFRALPYTRSVRPVEDEAGAYYLAYVAEIPSIRIDGATREEALLRLDEVFDDLIMALFEEGVDLPEPPLWPGSAARFATARPSQIRLQHAVVQAEKPAAHFTDPPQPWEAAREGSTAAVGTVSTV